MFVVSLVRDFWSSGDIAKLGPQAITAPMHPETTAKVSLGRACPTDNMLAPGAEEAPLPDWRNSAPVWASPDGGTPFAVFHRTPRFRGIFVSDGTGVTNRFIEHSDNAAVFAGMVRALLRPGGKVVFIEAAIGNSADPSLLEIMGGWAVASWWQAALLFAVVVYTLGKRFGLPEPHRYRQRGARELVDAVADLYHRGRSTHVASAAILTECDRQIRQALKLGRDAKRSERDALLPPELVQAFALCEAASQARGNPRTVLGLARDLERRTADFLGLSRVPAVRRPRR